MSNEIIVWVVSVIFYEQVLMEINEVSNYFICVGFVLMFNDEEGMFYELGINIFGLLSGQMVEEVKVFSVGLVEVVFGCLVEIVVVIFVEWLKV